MFNVFCTFATRWRLNRTVHESCFLPSGQQVFHDVAYKAKDRNDLVAGIDEFLDQVTVLPPGEWDPSIRIEPPKNVPSQVNFQTALTQHCSISRFIFISQREPTFKKEVKAASECVGADTNSAHVQRKFKTSALCVNPVQTLMPPPRVLLSILQNISRLLTVTYFSMFF